jgi:lactoylglutathione lyase
MKIVHLALKVDDIEASKEFYETVFGFKAVHEAHKHDRTSYHLTDGYIDFALTQYKEGASSRAATALGQPTGIHHFGFEVEDVDGFVGELKRRDIDIITDPGVVPVKFWLPGGGLAEVAPKGHFRTD